METKAVRLYGVDDLKLEEFELPEIGENEILIKIMTDSICMSTYKEVKQGADHIRVPDNIAEHPIIIGHEFAGKIMQVGDNWKDKYHVGKKCIVYPSISGEMAAPGYSFEYYGGDATYCIIPEIAIEEECVIELEADSYFGMSVIEPLSCVIGGYHTNLHSVEGSYVPSAGTKKNGNIIILGGCGAMGLGAVSYALAMQNKPRMLVVTDVSDERITRAQKLISEEFAKECGVDLYYVNTASMEDEKEELLRLTDNHGYDDVFVYAPIQSVAETGNAILAEDGCMNFFAGPTDHQFKAEINLYDSHYKRTKILGSSGCLKADYLEAAKLISEKKVNAAIMITHIGGLNACVETTKNLPKLKGSKKLIYTQIEMPLTAIEDFAELGKKDLLMKKLAESCERHNGLWNAEAERILLEHFDVR